MHQAYDYREVSLRLLSSMSRKRPIDFNRIPNGKDHTPFFVKYRDSLGWNTLMVSKPSSDTKDESVNVVNNHYQYLRLSAFLISMVSLEAQEAAPLEKEDFQEFLRICHSSIKIGEIPFNINNLSLVFEHNLDFEALNTLKSKVGGERFDKFIREISSKRTFLDDWTESKGNTSNEHMINHSAWIACTIFTIIFHNYALPAKW
jgi:hypothetical protein